MITRIALTICVALLAGAASLPESVSQNASGVSKSGKSTVVAGHGARSGYIVASS